MNNNIEMLISKIEFYREISINNNSYRNYINNLIYGNYNRYKEVYNSNSIEGNTITLGDTISYLEKVFVPEELMQRYSHKELYEISNYNNAIEYMLKSKGCDLTEEFIKELHYTVCQNVNEDAGEYKNKSNGTLRNDGSLKHYTYPSYVPTYMNELISSYNLSNKTLIDICYLKLDFILIHPFSDGNGRVSRLLLNWSLISNNYLPVTINIEERSQYLEYLNVYNEDKNNKSFIIFILNKLLNVYLEVINTNTESKSVD